MDPRQPPAIRNESAIKAKIDLRRMFQEDEQQRHSTDVARWSAIVVTYEERMVSQEVPLKSFSFLAEES